MAAATLHLPELADSACQSRIARGGETGASESEFLGACLLAAQGDTTMLILAFWLDAAAVALSVSAPWVCRLLLVL